MSRESMGLAALQAAFMDALQGAKPDERLIENLRSPMSRPAIEALSIYRHSMQLTLVNALRLTYPTVERMIGEECLAAAAVRFIRDTPSRHGDLDRYGAGFADHLQSLPLATELPWLSDLARFEWLLHDLHGRAPEPSLSRGELAAIDIGHIADRSLTLVRRAALFESAWPVARLWLAHRASAGDPDFDGIGAGPDRVLVCASEPIRILPLDEASWRFFGAIEQQATLLLAVESACAIDPSFDLQSAFAAALDCGALSSTVR